MHSSNVNIWINNENFDIHKKCKEKGEKKYQEVMINDKTAKGNLSLN